MSLLNLFAKRTKSFLVVLKEYFASVSRGKKDSTLERYVYFYNNIEKFLLDTDRTGVGVGEIKVSLMEEMRQWLHNERKRTEEHVSRHIEHCQAAMDYAALMEYVKYNPISAIKSKRDKLPEPVSLTATELKKFYESEFTTPKRQLVVDLFLFQCFTGLSYVDLWLYEIEKDKIEIEGVKQDIFFVTGKLGRGKNGKPYSVELNKYARDIYNKYEGKFPQITNQGYNKILKKIAFALNINKDLSSHNARKTYATMRYNQGMSFEGLADELGNTPDVLRKSYLTKSRERIKRDIQSLRGPLVSFG